MSVTAIRADAYNLLERMPEETLFSLVEMMRGIEDIRLRKKTEGNSPAFHRLMSICRPMPGLNEKKELASWREEKFGDAGVD